MASGVKVVVPDASVTQTCITLAVDEVRVKFPKDVEDGYAAKALDAAQALWSAAKWPTTLRGRLHPDGDGFKATLVTTNNRTVGAYRINGDLSVAVKNGEGGWSCVTS